MSTNTDWDAIIEIFDMIEDAELISEFDDVTWISVRSEDYQRALRIIGTIGLE
mgnify:CR=1 FL=1